MKFYSILLTEMRGYVIIYRKKIFFWGGERVSLFEVSTDSTADLKKSKVEERNIWFVPLTFTMEKDGKIEEGVDNFSKEEEYVAFYQKITDGYFPRTAKLNYQAHIDHFTKMAQAGVKETLHF